MSDSIPGRVGFLNVFSMELPRAPANIQDGEHQHSISQKLLTAVVKLSIVDVSGVLVRPLIFWIANHVVMKIDHLINISRTIFLVIILNNDLKKHCAKNVQIRSFF